MGVHVSLQGNASQLMARIVTNDKAFDLHTRLLQKLDNLLCFQKSLNEAIGRLPPEAFTVFHHAAV
jgi:hypothetical protein